jgi:hypothetical protein
MLGQLLLLSLLQLFGPRLLVDIELYWLSAGPEPVGLSRAAPVSRSKYSSLTDSASIRSSLKTISKNDGLFAGF